MTTDGDAVLLLNAACTFALVGLIWVVQLVHYPAFDSVDRGRFIAFEKMHRRRITFIVAPLMLGEGLSSILLLAWRPQGIPFAAAVLGVVLAAAMWISTVLVQAPCHARLAAGYDREIVRRLIVTNMFRTAGWSLRGILLLWMMRAAWLRVA